MIRVRHVAKIKVTGEEYLQWMIIYLNSGIHDKTYFFIDEYHITTCMGFGNKKYTITEKNLPKYDSSVTTDKIDRKFKVFYSLKIKEIINKPHIIDLVKSKNLEKVR